MTGQRSDVTPEASIEEARRLFDRGEPHAAMDLFASLHPADQAELLAELDDDQRAAVLPRIDRAALAEIIDYLDEEPREAIVKDIEPSALGPLLDNVDRDVAADVLRALPSNQAQLTLATMATAAEVAPLLTHEDETAGGRMTSDFVALHKDWSVDDALSYLRRTHPAAEESYYLYVVDDEHRLEGVVSLRRLIVALPEERIERIMTPEIVAAGPDEDQEEVARKIARYDLLALPIVDEDRRLVGVVTVDSAIDVAEEEATEDMYRMAGVGVKERAFSPLAESVVRRVPWLSFNMIWAFAGAAVISLFQGTIKSVPAVAIFMPMIAGQAGNAGIQTATIVVRSMALDEVGLGDLFRLLSKEWALGTIKGVIFGVALGLIAWLWQHDATLGIIAGTAMFLNMLVAATAGVLIPMTLRRLGFDPATIAGVFDTMITDFMGFLIFLGLATIFVTAID